MSTNKPSMAERPTLGQLHERYRSLSEFTETIEERLENNWTNGADVRFLLGELRGLLKLKDDLYWLLGKLTVTEYSVITEKHAWLCSIEFHLPNSVGNPPPEGLEAVRTGQAALSATAHDKDGWA